MSWSAVIGIASVVSFLIPVVVIVYHRLYKHRSLAALMIYYLLVAFYNLMSEHLIPSSSSLQNMLGIMDNFLDVPLMLTSLLFFCPNKQKQKFVNLLTLLYIGYEVIITLLFGFNRNAIIYIMGPGIGIIIIYTFYLFIRQIKFSVVHGKNVGRTLMLSSILFSYTCYGIIYYFFYIQKTPYKSDTMLIYFISSMLASIVMGAGIQMMSKRIKELNHLKITRKELATFFG
jgi:hypothetical protein